MAKKRKITILPGQMLISKYCSSSSESNSNNSSIRLDGGSDKENLAYDQLHCQLSLLEPALLTAEPVTKKRRITPEHLVNVSDQVKSHQGQVAAQAVFQAANRIVLFPAERVFVSPGNSSREVTVAITQSKN